MGMAASQVRFLSLQNRNSDISRQLTMLSNRKLALSRDMNRVSQNYTNALNQTLLKWSNDSGVSYNNLTYDLLMTPNDLNSTLPYIVTDANTGKVVLNNDAILDVNGKTIKYGVEDDGSDHYLSYIDIATMISTYSGMSTGSDGVTNIELGNTDSVYTATDQYGSNVLYGTSAIDDAYYIPDTTTFSFNNTLRYSIFELLGLVSDDDIKQQDNLLIQLYGSAEAEETGVYPVGSAWGDYYLAIANLEAYEDYVKNDQYLATGGGAIYAGSNMTAVDIVTCSDNYIYDAYVDATQGSSTITQTNFTSSGAASHIDFSNIVTTNTDGNYCTAAVSTGTDLSAYEDTYTDGNFTYSTSISSSGITNEYYNGSGTDLLATALANYEADKGSLGTQTTKNDYTSEKSILQALKYANTSGSTSTGTWGSSHDDMTNDTFGFILVKEKRKDYKWDKSDRQACYAAMVNVLDAYMDLMVNYGGCDEYAMLQAVALTYDFYCGANLQNCVRSIDRNNYEAAAKDAAVNSADELNGFGICHKRFHANVGEKAKRRETAIYLDAGTVYATLMSYYYTCLIGEQDGSRLISDYMTADATYKGYRESEVTDGDVTYNPFVVTDSSSGATTTYVDGSYTSSDGYTYITRGKVSRIASMAGESESADLYTNLGGTTFSDEYGTLGAIHAVYLDSTYDESAYYKTDGTTFTYEKDDGILYTTSTGSNDIYGIVQTYSFTDDTETETVYALLTSGAVTDYQSGMSITDLVAAGKAEEIETVRYSCGTSWGSTLYDYSGAGVTGYYKDGSEGNYTIYIDSSVANSDYAITMATSVYDDDGYRYYLQEKVDKAWDHILDLEDQLENFYGAADQKLMDYYDALFLRIAQNGWVEDDRTSSSNSNSTTYLDNKLQNYDYFLTVCQEKADETGYNYTTKMASSITRIYEVNDTAAQNLALTQYETEKTLISNKEDKIDIVMQMLETEQEAIKTEMDSLEDQRDKNIESTFKIFA